MGKVVNMKIGTETCRYCGAVPLKLKHIVNRLIKAEIANSWKGGGHPEDWPAIDQELKDARRAWRVALEEIS